MIVPFPLHRATPPKTDFHQEPAEVVPFPSPTAREEPPHTQRLGIDPGFKRLAVVVVLLT